MQPGPQEVNQEPSLSNETPGPENTSTQHGLQDRDGPASPLPRAEGGRELSEAQQPSENHTDPEQDSGSYGDSVASELGRLTSSLDRVTDYESDQPSTPRGHEMIPGFRITKRGKTPLTGPSVIAQFPNEVLTHVLSHLPPQSLSIVALVSHRFHDLVTTPHAWRDAFSRFFPGPDSLPTPLSSSAEDGGDTRPSKQRLFARLTALASWRTEYVLRTRLLRSLARGKPDQTLRGPASQGSHRGNSGHSGSATITYGSQLFATVDHIHALFGPSSVRKPPKFIHGAGEVGSVCSSDASTGKVDNWGLSDPQTFLQFDERFPGDAPWGLGAGDVVGCSNVLDVSQPYGMVYGEGSPGGLVYFRSVSEMRGRFLAFSDQTPAHELGIPRMSSENDSICSVWIAKTKNIPEMSEDLFGIFSGSSHGVLTSYSLGSNGLRKNRIDRGLVTARWVLSPGVPIIAITADDSYNGARKVKRRVFAVALNALGEVFYLTDMPQRPKVELGARLDERGHEERLAWVTGRSVPWNLVEATRRVAHVDPYDDSTVDGSYSPRSSWDGMGLSLEQIGAETREIEVFISHKPKHYRKICDGWDMRRKIEVDFAGDDNSGAGESVFLIYCGHEGNRSRIARFTRCKVAPTASRGIESPIRAETEPPLLRQQSLFGGSVAADLNATDPISPRTPSPAPASGHTTPRPYLEEWRMTEYSLEPLKNIKITALAVDKSTFSLLTTLEDPIMSLGTGSTALSPMTTPGEQSWRPQDASEIPGQRARYLGVGTDDGRIMLWNMRCPISANSELVNTCLPSRMIQTDSPQISCLALTSLYMVHGGNDGLVQAWDPLASVMQPIRTLNSRFSSRARRRLVQAEASTQGVGINLFAAGALCLDPDPTVLRGMVSLGTHLRYWSYSSSAADNYASRKRRLRRRSERGSNNPGGEGRFSNTGRGALKDYIINEKLELEREKENKRRDTERLAGRFGVGLLGHGESEEEVLAYARMLSQETFAKDEEKRRSECESAESFKGSDSSSAWSSDTVTPEGSAVGRSSPAPEETKDDKELDADIEKAIRLSLGGDGLEATSSSEGSSPPNALPEAAGVPFRYVKSRHSSPSTSPATSQTRARKSRSPPGPGPGSSGRSSNQQAALESDLDFALKLSLAEEASRKEAAETGEGFPALARKDAEADSKGKGKAT